MGKIRKQSKRNNGIRVVSWRVESDFDFYCIDVVWSRDFEDRRWQLDVVVAKYIRDGALAAVLEDTVTRALLGVRRVGSAVREGTETCFIEGGPRAQSLMWRVPKALESLIPQVTKAASKGPISAVAA